MNKEKMREEFEAWMYGQPCSTDKQPEVRRSWEVWQAACASKQEEIDELCDALRRINEEITDRMDDGDFCKPSLIRTLNSIKKVLTQYNKHALHCPNCPDQGWYAVETGGCSMDGENDTRQIEQVQCEFCCLTPDSVFNIAEKDNLK